MNALSIILNIYLIVALIEERKQIHNLNRTVDQMQGYISTIKEEGGV